MSYRKITTGFVIQTFDDVGDCIEQEFVAGDVVEYEDDEGNPATPPVDEKYHPYCMVQP